MGTILLNVFDKDRDWQGVFQPNTVTMVARWNATSDLSFVMDADHPQVARLTEDGARVVGEYFRDGDTDHPVETISGQVLQIDGEGDLAAATRTFTVRDDFNVLSNLGWPNPTMPIDQQSVNAYDVITAPCESAVLAAITRMSERLELGLLFPYDYGRGHRVTLKLRMHPLIDKILDPLNVDKLGIRVVQRNTALGHRVCVEIVQPETYDQELTELSGVLSGPSFSTAQATVTRVIVGAGGEAEAREFREYIKDDLEQLYGDVRETFVDARDIQPPGSGEDELTPEEFDQELQDRADEAFADGTVANSLDVTLAETGAFEYGKAFNLGDTISVRLAGAPLLTDQVTEVEISDTPEDGLTVTPKVGSKDDTTDAAVIGLISKIARNVREIQRR